ncbi:MAG TPA: GDP-L-fucose synthase [Pelovirga sp.]|nr:GDP-L-fucose synthase [Pelovirga sp.]
MGSETPVIFVAGHNGMVGSAIVRQLKSLGHTNLLTRTRQQLDLLDQQAVRDFFAAEQIDQVYLAAARVGGIHANNSYPAEFIYENLQIATNVIHAAYQHKVSRLLYLGSSCVYPRDAQQPIREEALLTGLLEPTNEPYAIAKIAGIKLCESYNRQYDCDFRCVMPTNLYGPGDNFHSQNSHVVPGLIRRIHRAAVQGHEEVVVWGTGLPRREFLHVDDMAAASVHVMNLDEQLLKSRVPARVSHVNVGSGVDCSISELAEQLAELLGFRGRLVYDDSYPEGTPRKLLDVSVLTSLGWSASISLQEGLRTTCDWYLEREAHQYGR